MFSLLSKVFGSSKTSRTPIAKAARLQARPQVEGLEDRMVMSATVSSGDIYIYGTNGADTVTVKYESYSGVGYYKVTQNGVNQWFTAASVYGGDVAFYGYDGNDYFNNFTGLRSYAWGHN